VRAYAAAAKLHPEDAATHLSLHFAYLELGNYAASRREAQEIVRINPGSSGIAQVSLARALGGDVPGARATIEKELAKEPGSFDLRLVYSYVLMLQRDPRAKDEMLGCFPWFLKSPPEVDGGAGSFFAPETIYLLRQSGDDAHADALASAYREWLDVNWKPAKGTERGAVLGFRASLAAANNDRNDILRQLTALYDTGGLVAAYFAREPMMQPHVADPRVVELMKKFDARRAEWLKQLAAEGL
jgi:tetratricopeptide (TPR) repeat protein